MEASWHSGDVTVPLIQEDRKMEIAKKELIKRRLTEAVSDILKGTGGFMTTMDKVTITEMFRNELSEGVNQKAAWTEPGFVQVFKPGKIDPVKKEEGKVRTDLLPVDALFEIAKVLTFGANKHGAHSWEEGTEWSKIYGAAMRHMLDFWGCQNFDNESSLFTIAHATCNLMFLLSYQLRGLGKDDRVRLWDFRNSKKDPSGTGGCCLKRIPPSLLHT